MAALQTARRGVAPALILLDLWMPVLDGWGFLERRCEEPDLAAVPVIVMSASPFERHIPGVQRLLEKPIRFDDLLEAVRSEARTKGADRSADRHASRPRAITLTATVGAVARASRSRRTTRSTGDRPHPRCRHNRAR